MKKLLTLIFILLMCGNCWAGMLIGSGSSESFTADYYVRFDGVSTKINATSPLSASTSMSMVTFNASTFSDDDVVEISSRGGNYSAVSMVVPTGGSGVGSEITYQGESGHIPVFTSDTTSHIAVLCTKSNVILKDINSWGSVSSNFEFSGTATNIQTYSLDGRGSYNQAFQHLNSVTVTHNDIYGSTADDEIFSIHDTGTITINGGVFDVTAEGGPSEAGINYVGTPTVVINDLIINLDEAGTTGIEISGTGSWTLRDCTINSNNATATVIAMDNGGTWDFQRCTFNEHVDNAVRGIDWDASVNNITLTYKNCIFNNLTDGDFYLLFRSNITAITFVNNTLIGDGVNTTTAVFNNYAGNYVNNIFIDTGTESFFDTTGTIDSNLYYNSGTARGTNTVTTDPSLSATGRITSTGSSAYDTGVGPSSNALVPSDDIDENSRAGLTADIGASEYTP